MKNILDFIRQGTSHRCHSVFCRKFAWYRQLHEKDGGYAPIHWSTELAFCIGMLTAIFSIFCIGGVVIQSVNADSSSTSVSVTNAIPIASSASVNAGAGSMTLTENTTTAVTCTATVTDNNGCEDITTGSAVFYRTNVGSGSGCSGDSNNCYSAIPCNVDGGSCTGGGSDLTATYTCTNLIQYYADPTDAGSTYEATDWTCEVTPIDLAGNGTADTDVIEMDTLTALNVTSTIAYGSVALSGNTGVTNQTTVVTNTGNEEIDAQISGTIMTCTIGIINAVSQKYDTSDVTYASLANSLTGSPETLTLTLPQSTGVAVTDDIFWGLTMPATGVGGSCSGTNTFTAVSG
ncbi:MAG: hypothetical protein ABIA47_01195 [bacterium]